MAGPDPIQTIRRAPEEFVHDLAGDLPGAVGPDRDAPDLDAVDPLGDTPLVSLSGQQRMQRVARAAGGRRAELQEILVVDTEEDILAREEEARRLTGASTADGPLLATPGTTSGRAPTSAFSTAQFVSPEKRAELLTKTLTAGYHYYTPDASSYPNRYYLELYPNYAADSLNPTDAVSLQYINAVSKHDPVALVRGRGIDGTVYQENEGFMEAVFTLQGRSGDTALDHFRFQKMRNFLQLYAQEMKQHKNALVRGKDVQLVLHFPFEAESYLCDIVAFDYKRSTQGSTNSFEFTLTVVTNGRAERKWALPDTANAYAKLAAAADANHTQDARHPCLRLFERERTSRTPDTGEPFALITKTLLDVVNTPAPGCSEVDAGYRSIWNFTAWANLDVYSAYSKKLDVYMYTTMFASDLISSGLTYSGSRNKRCTPPPRTLRAYAAFGFDIRFQFAFRPSMVSGRTVVPTTPAEAYVCTQGKDSAYEVAADVYGDRERAPEIIDYNQMLDAFTLSDGTPLDIGSVVWVPQVAGQITVDGDALGTDLRIEDGDFVAVGDTDIAVVSGYACYAQNIRHRVTTVRSENKVFPKYGLKPYVGQTITTDVPADLRANVRGQVLADHRTERIIALTLSEQGDKVDVTLHLKPLGTQPTRVQFTYNLAG